MENPQNPYNNQQPQPSVPAGNMPPQGATMPPMMPPPPFKQKSKTWRDRIMQRYGMGMHESLQRGELIVPQWLVGKPILVFFIAFFACTLVFGYPLPLTLAILLGVFTLLFFYGTNYATRQWRRVSERIFLKNVFFAGFLIRMLWVLYSYFFFNPEFYGNAYGDMADTGWYMDVSNNLVQWVIGNDQTPLWRFIELNVNAIDDTGYPFWLGLEYLVTFGMSDVLVPFLTKSIMGAYCAVCTYNVAKRHFDVGTARIAAVFVMLNPNMIYWCASMMKEAEMVFLCCLFLDKTDYTLSTSNKLGFKQLLPGLSVGLALMLFRSALAIVAFASIFAHIVLVSHKVMSSGKKVIAGILVALVVLVGMGQQLRDQAEMLMKNVQEGGQKANMEWRAEREGGNSFAKYAGAAVFAPLIFTIPFPTFNQAEASQITQELLSGGYFIRNILSFFVILVMLLLVASGEWRKHVFILAYTVGYLVVLVFSGYAQSGRFHMPVWPMLMLFAAYGVQIAKGNIRIRREFNIVLVVEVFICLAWNWFKLKGRGMI